MEHGSLITELVIVLAASVATAVLFHRWRVPTIICYLLVGIAVGPQALGLVHDVAAFQHIAEFGVAFLLFTLGLEFSLPHLIALRRVVFGMGTLQVIGCISVFGTLIYLTRDLYEVSVTATLIIAAAIALSSTAIVSKELTTRNELNSEYGSLAIGILLFQDIAAIIILVLISSSGGSGETSLWLSLAQAGLRTIGFFLAVVLIGKWVLPHLFTEISKTRSEELFVLTVLVVALIAAATAHALGLAMALGAFMAGMMLGESHFKHQIEMEIRPFRDVLLGIFFVSVGLIIDLQLLLDYWPRIIFFAVCLLAFKAVLITLLCLLFRHNGTVSLQTGLALSQGGEFGFALLTLAVRDRLIPEDVASFFLAIIVLSMAATPVLVAQSAWIARILSEKTTGRAQTAPAQLEVAPTLSPAPVLLCGFGRVGKTLASLLREEEIPYVVIDDNASLVLEAQAAGEPIEFGSARQIKNLERLGLQRTPLVVITFDDPDLAQHIVAAVRQHRIDVPILVRTRDDSRSQALISAGASEVIPETLEASLMLASHILAVLKHDGERMRSAIDTLRRERYQLLESATLPLISTSQQQRPIYLPVGAFAVDKTLDELKLGRFRLQISAIRRANRIIPTPAASSVLAAADVIVISGQACDLEAAEAFLLTGQS